MTTNSADGTGAHGREPQPTLDEIFRAKSARPIGSADDLACDGIFDTDDELHEFLEYTYAARRQDRA